MKLYTETQDCNRGGAQYPAYAWPGGYPMFYLTADDGILCPECANGRRGSEAGSKHKDVQWRLVACDVNWEDDCMYCDHCNGKIESAYVD